jgi:prolyl-tRNA synthetase
VTEQDPCPRCGARLTLLKGIEVGHVFKLGFKYSKALNAKFLDAEGQEQYIFMGCYGIGVSRIVAASIEQGNDADGIIWPMPLAPFQVGLVPINVNDQATRETADRLHDELEAAGIEVLLDDRDERPGVKFKDMDLLGLPIRVVVGPKTLAKGQAEVRQRRSADVSLVDLDRLFPYIKDLISQGFHD